MDDFGLDVVDHALIAKGKLNLERAPWYIIRPNSRFMSGWDLVTAIALLLTAMGTPVEVAFLDPATSAASSTFIVKCLVRSKPGGPACASS